MAADQIHDIENSVVKAGGLIMNERPPLAENGPPYRVGCAEVIV